MPKLVAFGVQRQLLLIPHGESSDSLITARAIHNRLTIVTRNVKDFDYASVDVFNPWLK